MPENPYEASISDGGVKDVSSLGADSDTRELLLSIGRWQSFFAVLGVIGCLVISLGLVAQLVVEPAIYQRLTPGGNFHTL